MTQLVRDCSKYKPSTFNDTAFPIVQQIEAKIKNKNNSLRKKARTRIAQRQKIFKNQDTKDEYPNANKKELVNYNKLQRESLNYLEVYQPQKMTKEEAMYYPSPDIRRLDQKDQQTTLHIYLLLRKRKNIFKVEEVKRKLRTKDHNKRGSLRECQCCGIIGKHRAKCTHILCQRNCDKCKKHQEKQKGQSQQDSQRLISLAQQIIDGQEIQGPQVPTLQLKVKDDEIELPKIDVEEEANKDKMQDAQNEPQIQLEPIVQTERISEIESKSQISESRRNKSSIPEGYFEDKKEDESPFKKQ